MAACQLAVVDAGCSMPPVQPGGGAADGAGAGGIENVGAAAGAGWGTVRLMFSPARSVSNMPVPPGVAGRPPGAGGGARPLGVRLGGEVMLGVRCVGFGGGAEKLPVEMPTDELIPELLPVEAPVLAGESAAGWCTGADCTGRCTGADSSESRASVVGTGVLGPEDSRSSSPCAASSFLAWPTSDAKSISPEVPTPVLDSRGVLVPWLPAISSA